MLQLPPSWRDMKSIKPRDRDVSSDAPLALMDLVAHDRVVRILKPILWRHSKRHVADEITLPVQRFEVLALEFHPAERQFYQAVLDHVRNVALKKLMDQSSAALSKNEVQLLQSLRQACCHPLVARQHAGHILGPSNLGKMYGLEELQKRLVQKARDDVAAAERKQCTALNHLAWLLRRLNRLDEAYSALQEAWIVADQGVSGLATSNRIDSSLSLSSRPNVLEQLKEANERTGLISLPSQGPDLPATTVSASCSDADQIAQSDSLQKRFFFETEPARRQRIHLRKLRREQINQQNAMALDELRRAQEAAAVVRQRPRGLDSDDDEEDAQPDTGNYCESGLLKVQAGSASGGLPAADDIGKPTKPKPKARVRKRARVTVERLEGPQDMFSALRASAEMLEAKQRIEDQVWAAVSSRLSGPESAISKDRDVLDPSGANVPSTLTEGDDIVTNNAQFRLWRLIELVTTTRLADVSEARAVVLLRQSTSTSKTQAAECLATAAKMRRQHLRIRNDLLESDVLAVQVR